MKYENNTQMFGVGYCSHNSSSTLLLITVYSYNRIPYKVFYSTHIILLQSVNPRKVLVLMYFRAQISVLQLLILLINQKNADTDKSTSFIINFFHSMKSDL